MDDKMVLRGMLTAGAISTSLLAILCGATVAANPANQSDFMGWLVFTVIASGLGWAAASISTGPVANPLPTTTEGMDGNAQ